MGFMASTEEAKGHPKCSQHSVEHRLHAHLTDWKPGAVSSWSPAQHSPHFSSFRSATLGGSRAKEDVRRARGSTQVPLSLRTSAPCVSTDILSDRGALAVQPHPEEVQHYLSDQCPFFSTGAPSPCDVLLDCSDLADTGALADQPRVLELGTQACTEQGPIHIKTLVLPYFVL
ncbi:hypothetical protein DPMN_121885 [Dreissena polymorpha]|uniref:Uncharacterized protein n=1 Tax=Dreissena polymorpha TaxID=45954 RepID=A0A9D4GMH6_DREPO|nr:hypothetical protein DPMN_121885 [Dreissena polymorpha]